MCKALNFNAEMFFFGKGPKEEVNIFQNRTRAGKKHLENDAHGQNHRVNRPETCQPDRGHSGTWEK